MVLSGKTRFFYHALLLTGVNLLLRAVGTSFQVYLSGRIGAAGIGLLQLTMSVGSLAMVAGMGGIRTTTMYLTAEELGKGRSNHIAAILSSCFTYSILLSVAIGGALFCSAPWIADHWIGDSRTASSIRLFSLFLPAVCLSGVMSGYFTAANRIRTLAAVEVAEQLFSMTVTMLTLQIWARQDPGRACLCVVLGSSLGTCLTLSCLVILRLREPNLPSVSISVWGRLLQSAVPLALADDLKSGISTVENLMIPKRLALHTGSSEPFAAFGLVSGMVFPVIMFPAALLFSLNELLIPELARCRAADNRGRIQHLVQKTLRVAMIYGIAFSGVLFLLSDFLCQCLYGNLDAAAAMRRYALLIPMLYCDCVTDAMTKGLGQQKICVRYNILTSFLDVLFLYLLLPKYGMGGYFVSFLITHLINFILSLRRLMKITKRTIPFYIPTLAVCAAMVSVFAAGFVGQSVLKAGAYLLILGSLLFLLKVLTKEDLVWIKGVIKKSR